MSAQLGPATWLTAPPIGSSALVGIRSSPWSRKSSRRSSAYCLMSGLTARSAGRLLVASVPTPRFTSPVPSGKIQP